MGMVVLASGEAEARRLCALYEDRAVELNGEDGPDFRTAWLDATLSSCKKLGTATTEVGLTPGPVLTDTQGR